MKPLNIEMSDPLTLGLKLGMGHPVTERIRRLSMRKTNLLKLTHAKRDMCTYSRGSWSYGACIHSHSGKPRNRSGRDSDKKGRGIIR